MHLHSKLLIKYISYPQFIIISFILKIYLIKILKKMDSLILIQYVVKIIITESFISLQVSICQYF
jgi:hypothetical protein